MIAYQWSIFPRMSTAAMIATGITDNQDRARTLTETCLGSDDNAAWGVVQRISMPLENTLIADDPLEPWILAGEQTVCRRGISGFVWVPLISPYDGDRAQ